MFSHRAWLFMVNRRCGGYAFQSIVWDEETEESRGVILASGGDIGVHVLVAGDDCLVVRGGDFMFHEVSERRGKVGGSVRDGVRAWVVGAVFLVLVFENVVGVLEIKHGGEN